MRRFFIHKSIEALADAIIKIHGQTNERAMLFPSHSTATRCQDFVLGQLKDLDPSKVRVLDFKLQTSSASNASGSAASPEISAFIYPSEHFSVAKSFWQHSGEGASSRRAEFCHQAFNNGELALHNVASEPQAMSKGPRRYQKSTSAGQLDLPILSNGVNGANGSSEHQDHTRFVEERFGRNLNAAFADDAKLAIRRRIAGSLTADVELEDALQTAEDTDHKRNVSGFSADDVYLYPCGMNAIFTTHRMLKLLRGPQQSICYGFPYIDTLKILEKFGPGALFYGFGSSGELEDLEKRLSGGEKFLALFCEFPGNPTLSSPDLVRIRALADQYDFFVVVDETIGTLLNVNVLPYSDVVVSSLTKIFSGDCNVMGGR